MDYNRYYLDQAGNGLAKFQGYRFQKGHGFFGRLIKSFAKPLLGYLGKHVFKTGRNIVDDVLSGKNIKESGRARLRETLGMVGDDVEAKFMQKGRGYTPRKAIKARPALKRHTLKRSKRSLTFLD